jgi:hypothetical protein
LNCGLDSGAPSLDQLGHSSLLRWLPLMQIQCRTLAPHRAQQYATGDLLIAYLQVTVSRSDVQPIPAM